jgi:hypothetical protein
VKRRKTMDNLLDCETRQAEHYRTVAEIDRDGWKKPPAVHRYRVKVAKVLIALATRLAPTVTVPPPTRVLAR